MRLEGRNERSEDFMVLTSGSVVINRPLEEVFAFIAKPENWPKFVTGLTDVKSKTILLRKGDSFEWTFMVKRISLRGKGKVLELINNKRIILQMHNLVPIRENIVLQRFEDKTVLSIEIGYTKPGRILSFLFRAIIYLINLRQLSVILNNIKNILEKGYSVKEARG